MTDSVWWYVFAGFLLGFILSTLWEWLYFRRRRMQIENQRIAELEATVRSLSTVSQSAEANTPSGFAAGYQSPMVFLEGEEDDVDTVEVIVPAPAEPTDYEQFVTGQTLSSEQPRTGTQFVAASVAPTGRTPASNGNGVVREAPGETAKREPAAVTVGSVETTPSTLSPAALAAGVAAATVWAQDKERTDQAAAEQLAREQSPEEHMPGLVGDLSPSRQISAVSTAPDETEHTSAPAQSAAQFAAQPTSVDQRADTTVHVTAQPTTQTGEAQPVIAGALPPPAVPGQPDRQKAEEDSGLTPAGVAVLASAFASKLAGDQQRSPEASQQQALQPPGSQEPPAALPQAAASESQAISESAAAARVVPVVYDIPDPQSSTQPDTPGDTSANTSAGTSADNQGEQQTPAGTVTGVSPEQDHDPAMGARSGMAVAEAQGTNAATPANTGSAPSEVERVGPAADLAIEPGAGPQSLAPQEQGSVLPLSAILPRAAKPAPLSKGGQARRPDATPANAVAAAGIEPEIEQVSNQLDDLIDSINGLIERTQPLLEQPASQVAPSPPPFASTSPTAVGDYGAGDDSGTEEGVDAGISGPYSAQNLSRMEYGLVQLMQAVRRLGRDVRSAF